MGDSCAKHQTDMCQPGSALSNPKASISLQKRHPYTENPNSEMSGDVFLHCGDVAGLQ